MPLRDPDGGVSPESATAMPIPSPDVPIPSPGTKMRSDANATLAIERKAA
jgi:hypothetical protein